MSEIIKDYLQTQGLRLNADDVAVAYATARAVMSAERAVVEHGVLWRGGATVRLVDYLVENKENTEHLKQIFIALDASCERQRVQSAAVYRLLPEQGLLLCVAQQGKPLEPALPADEAHAQTHLAARTAQTGWLNRAGDTARWLDNGSLNGAHNRRSAAQTCLPLCATDGRVWGVLHIEYARTGDDGDHALCTWVGLALALHGAVSALQTCAELSGTIAPLPATRT
ncbi:GAF domain-containing protein [Conchiformibius kuhniae]|uniref:GAF domain-containing protein n=1 Tax=Conchiformibius kuhniae TaxID=211502 RepID=A0A8T9MT40_9NEIS|nr:GAF domain-containing protein [Conchiformibius kuhniae]UOP04429.1 GAF domain-containing protein [Conchiformibius kuhniae]